MEIKTVVISLAVVVALVAVVRITWGLWRALSARRWRAALDAAYARHEQAKKTMKTLGNCRPE
jgi:hypothetical protein